MCDFEELMELIRSFACNQYPQCEDCEMVLNGHECRGAIERQAADAIEKLLSAVPHWISVEERLPEQGERVLVSNGGFICESYLSQSGRWQRGGVDMFFMTPTHWMPLPEPPKEVE